jgi:hypothetical protein
MELLGEGLLGDCIVDIRTDNGCARAKVLLVAGKRKL